MLCVCGSSLILARTADRHPGDERKESKSRGWGFARACADNDTVLPVSFNLGLTLRSCCGYGGWNVL